MKTILPLVVAFLLLSITAHARDPIVGDWKWFTGEVIKFNANGEAVSSKGHSGKWTRETARTGEYKYTISWKDGEFTDIVSLSRDRKQLAGNSKSGVSVSAERWRK
ncbi:MAG: hypothetical protein EOP84_24800 [Verrucomicrobiaceae bacterium]|nr:MAG: hypothetical protein EOP84_24800 [Verrucomicrobiaceae bacterium]